MNKRHALFAIIVTLLFSLACLGLSQPALEPPTGSPRNQVPLYPDSRGVTVNESDLVTIIGDMLGSEYSLYSSSTDISWTEDTGARVQERFDELLPDSNWRLESDWHDYGQFYISTWRYGDLHVVIACLDNLDSEQISNFKRRYGISGPQPGSTVIITHLWDTSKPLPTATPTKTPIPSPTPTFPPSVEVEVFANLGWQDTGYYIEAGDTVEIRHVSGEWTRWIGKVTPHDANGTPDGYVCAQVMPASQCVEPVPDAIAGSLVARIGNLPPMYVGNSSTFVASTSGSLEFAINDGLFRAALADNDGSILVRVTISKPR